MKTREDLEKLAREICWQWDFDCSKTLQSLDKVSQREMLAEAIFEALIKVQDEALKARLPSEEDCGKKAIEICLNEPERATQQFACENTTRQFYDWLREHAKIGVK